MTLWERLKTWLGGSEPVRPVHSPPVPPLSFWELSEEAQAHSWWRQDPATKARYLELHPELQAEMQQAQTQVAQRQHHRLVDPTGKHQARKPGDPGFLKSQIILNTRNPETIQRAQEEALKDTSGRLTVHHLSYQHHRDEWNHQEDLITLCQPCHSADHVAKPWLQAPKPYPGYYTAYVSSPYWHQVRQAVLRRDGYRCRNCGSAGHASEPTFTMPRSRRGAMNQLLRMMDQ